MTKVINLVLGIYALAMIGMGLQGFLVKNSIPSLAAGGSIGALILISLFVWTKSPRAGRIMALVVALVGVGSQARNIPKGLALYPNVTILVLSLIVVLVLGMGHMMAKKESAE